MIKHKLGIDPVFKPVKQRKRRDTLDKRAIIHQEVNRMLEASFTRVVDYLEWIANPMLAPKPDGLSRMFINYTLNKACPKHEYPLPRIHQIIDSTCTSRLLCFLDVYSGYNQSNLHVEDEEKTAYVTPFSIVCYVKMPFDLKNTRLPIKSACTSCSKRKSEGTWRSTSTTSS